MKTWQLQDAKAKFSKLVRTALESGPQGISVHGNLEVILISKKEYDQLKKPKQSFLELMRKSPLYGLDLELERDQSKGRKIKL